MLNILILTDSYLNPNQEELSRLKNLIPEAKIIIKANNSYQETDIVNADIILGSPKIDSLKQAKSLKWLQLQSAGCTAYADKTIYPNKTVILSNASGSYGLPIAEHVIGYILIFNHEFLKYKNQQKAHIWKSYYMAKDLTDSSILIVGFGDIGKQVAKKTKELGMKTMVIKRTATEKPNYVDKLSTTEDLKKFIPKADYICLTTPLTPKTKGFFDKECIALMKPNSYFINIARGPLVDEKALIRALQNKNIAGAALDVTNTEPLEDSSPLWDLDNVILTPHASGLSLKSKHFVFDIFIENLEHFLQKEPLKNQVNFDRKY